MRGVYFGNYHTVEDWGLILSAKSIDPPTPKIVNRNVDGRDGTLDLSRALTGDMKFNDREASFSFLVTEGKQSDRDNMIRNIINAVHGKRLNIIEPDDLDHYFIGECTVKEVYNDKAYGSFTVTAECDPYRYSVNETIRRVTLSTTPIEVVLTNNGRRTLVPTITVSDSVNLVFGTTSASLSAGTHKLSSLALKNGTTALKVSGSGTVTFSYREAML
jgi:phage-related protein